MGENLEVQSEIYEDSGFDKSVLLDNKNSLLFLQYSRSSNCDNIREDEDGDLLVKRKQYNVIEVGNLLHSIQSSRYSRAHIIHECSPSTPVGLVGLQLWRGAFLLADYILSKPADFAGKVVLELGSGTGFTSIVAGIHAKEVISTDLNTGGILDLIKRNIARNKSILKAEFSVLPLDFCETTFTEKIREKLNTVDIILAADVVYENDLTEAFIETVIKLLDSPGKKKFYLALEKRYVFTLADLDTVAPCYEHFLSVFQKKSRRSPMASWKVREFPLDFKQSFRYDRSHHLVMWEIVT